MIIFSENDSLILAWMMLFLSLSATPITACASQGTSQRLSSSSKAVPTGHSASELKTFDKRHESPYNISDHTSLSLGTVVLDSQHGDHKVYSRLLPRTNSRDQSKQLDTSSNRSSGSSGRKPSPDDRVQQRVLSKMPIQRDDHFYAQVPKKRQRLDRSGSGAWTRGGHNAPGPAAATKDDSHSERKQNEKSPSPIGSTGISDRDEAVQSSPQTQLKDEPGQGQPRSRAKTGVLAGTGQVQSVRHPYQLEQSHEGRRLSRPSPRSSGIAAAQETSDPNAKMNPLQTSNTVRANPLVVPQAQIRGFSPLATQPTRRRAPGSQPAREQRMEGPNPTVILHHQLATESARRITELSLGLNAPLQQTPLASMRLGSQGQSAGNINPGPFQSWTDMVHFAALQHVPPYAPPPPWPSDPAARFPDSVPQADRMNRLLDAAATDRAQDRRGRPPPPP